MKLALIGDPVEHSRSPEIQARFLRDAGLQGTYEAIRVPHGDAAAAIARLRDAGYDGCNVTSPLKEEAFAACDVLTPFAQKAQAVNTIRFGSQTVGTDTDGVGAAAALRQQLGALRGCEILVLGTGPTARAVLSQLAEEGARLWLWGRDREKVLRLCATVGSLAFDDGAIEGAAFSALSPDATVPDSVAAACRAVPVVMDANYGDRSTLSRLLGRTVVDGSAMLEAQARASFEFWCGKA